MNPADLFRVVALCLMVGGCGNQPPAPAPVTIDNPLDWLAQSRNCDGNPATPLRQGDKITCRRFDFGHYQAEDSFLTPDGGAITTWSYPPFGPFVAANGDGGEHYKLDAEGNTSIDATQDGGKPGVVQHFTDWWLFNRHIPACSAGWAYGGLHGRACRTTITYPKIGPVDTIVSEHFSGLAPTGDVERILFGYGWGRLGWMAFRTSCTPPADLPARAPAISAFDGPPPEYPRVKCDERLVVNVESADSPLSGWHP